MKDVTEHWWMKDGKWQQMTEEESKLFSLLCKMMEAHVTEMEGYSYYGSNPGIPESNIEDIAEEMMVKLTIQETVGEEAVSISPPTVDIPRETLERLTKCEHPSDVPSRYIRMMASALLQNGAADD